MTLKKETAGRLLQSILNLFLLALMVMTIGIVGYVILGVPDYRPWAKYTAWFLTAMWVMIAFLKGLESKYAVPEESNLKKPRKYMTTLILIDIFWILSMILLFFLQSEFFSCLAKSISKHAISAIMYVAIVLLIYCFMAMFGRIVSYVMGAIIIFGIAFIAHDKYEAIGWQIAVIAETYYVLLAVIAELYFAWKKKNGWYWKVLSENGDNIRRAIETEKQLDKKIAELKKVKDDLEKMTNRDHETTTAIAYAIAILKDGFKPSRLAGLARIKLEELHRSLFSEMKEAGNSQLFIALQTWRKWLEEKSHAAKIS
jgi:hypothetical protein